MSEIKVVDKGGDSLTLIDHDGFRLPKFWGTLNFQGLKEAKFRDDDIFICTPAKSGTHLMRQIITFIIGGVTDSFITSGPPGNFLEAFSMEFHDKAPSPRVFFTHLPFNLLPRDILVKNCKLMFCLRNPKDQAVSYFHHTKGIKLYEYDGKWENYLDMWLEGKIDYGNWFDYVQQLEKAIENHPDLPIHLTFFEDIKENPVREIKRLSQFLNLNISDQVVHEIALKTDFNTMAGNKNVHRPAFFHNDFNMLRKGQVGDWKNWFTVAQSELFDSIFQERMKNSKLKFSFVLE
ncbi:hypothetical protein CHS0354_011101 [Potamilus streckersoni]|uniref:Sulfotransferase domain-containing protein n=1 Tax=Potamilus streckersoni TaxID=2493646 RepID=A0AAE0TBU9_9BIVA|nr:hypothetical protein CHS0354_011101 [Potamilus streckersoni]